MLLNLLHPTSIKLTFENIYQRLQGQWISVQVWVQVASCESQESGRYKLDQVGSLV